MSALYRLFLRSQLVKGRLVGIGLLGALAVLLGFAVGANDPTPGDGAQLVSTFGLSLFVPVSVLLFASAVLGDPNEDGTLVYLWLRPVPRWHLAAAAAAATLTICLPLVVVPMAVSAALVGADGLVIATVAACALAVTTYAAVFTWLGLRVKRALVWGLAYILIWEGFVARAGATPSKLSVRAASRSVLAELTDTPAGFDELATSTAVLLPALAIAATLALTVRRLHRQDVA